MVTSLSNLVDDLKEGIHKIKCKDCFLDNLIKYKCLYCNKDNSNKIDLRTHLSFSHNDINKLILF